MFQKKGKLGFADIAVSKRNIKVSFLEKIDKLIDWEEIEKVILKNYNRGKRPDGRPAFTGLLLFKMCLLQEWYGVSISRIEQMINDSVSLSHFIGLSLDDTVPSSTTLLSFRQELKKTGAYQELKNIIGKKLEQEQLTIRKGLYRPPVFMKKMKA